MSVGWLYQPLTPAAGQIQSGAIKDHFDGNSFSPRWNAGTGWSVSGGRAIGDPSLGGSFMYPTQNSLDLTGTEIKWQNAVFPDGSLGDAYCYISLYIDASNFVSWTITNTNVRAQKRVAGVTDVLYEVARNITTHEWMRIRETGGTTYWETSTDGDSWTTRHSEANPITLTALGTEIASQRDSGDATDSWEIESFGITPPILGEVALDIVASQDTLFATDDYNRGDGSIDGDTTSTGGYEWASPMHTGDGASRVVSNQLAPNNTANQYDHAILKTEVGQNVRVSATIKAVPSTEDDQFTINLRVPYETYPHAYGSGTTFYYLRCFRWDIPNDRIYVGRLIDAANTTMIDAADIGGEWAVNDEVSFECYEEPTGTRLIVRRKPSGGDWSEVASYLDTSGTRPTGTKIGTEFLGSAGGTPATWAVDDLRIERIGPYSERETLGASTLSVTANRVTGGFAEIFGASALTITNARSVAGFAEIFGGSVLTITNARTAAGALVSFGELDLDITYDPDVDGDYLRIGNSSLAITAAIVNSDLQRETFGASTLAVTANRVTSGFAEIFGASTLGLVVETEADGDYVRVGTISLPVTVSIVNNDLQRETFGASTLAITANRASAGYKDTFGEVELEETATIISAGELEAIGHVLLSGTAGIVTSGFKSVFGAITLPITYNWQIISDDYVFGAVILPLSADISASGIPTLMGNTALTLNSAITASGVHTIVAQVALPLNYDFTSTGRKTTFGSSTLAGTFATDTIGERTTFGSVLLSPSVLIEANYSDLVFGEVVLSINILASIIGDILIGPSWAFSDGFNWHQFVGSGDRRGLAEAGQAAAQGDNPPVIIRTGLAQPGQVPDQGNNPPYNTSGPLADSFK